MSDLRELLSSRHDLSRIFQPRNFIAVLPAVAITSTLANSDLESARSIVGWVAANLISFLTLAIIFGAYVRRPVAMSKNSATSLTLFLVGLLTGVFKSFSTAALANVFIGEIWFEDIFGSFTNLGIFVSPVILFLISFYISAKDSYLSQRDLLIAQRITQASNNRPNQSPLTEMQQGLVVDAKLHLSALRQQIQREGVSLSARQHANEIRTFVEFAIRPLSHRIWREQSREFSDYSVRDLTRNALVRGAYHPTILSIAILPGTLSWLTTNGPLEKVGVSLALILALNYAINLIAKQIGPLPFWSGVLRLLLVLASTIVGTWQLMVAHGTNLTPTDSAAVLISLFSYLPTFIWLVGIFTAGNGLRGKVAEELEGYFSEDSIDRHSMNLTLKLEAQRLAQTLHSQVQNDLLSTAMRLEQGHLVSSEEFDKQLRDIENSLDLLTATDGSSEPESIELGLASILAAWTEFVDLTYETSGELEPWQGRTKAIYQTINEAISNSIRHGRASKIRLKVHGGDVLEIQVEDDGIGPISPKPGLGYELFRQVSDGNFTLNDSGLGGSLIIRIPKN